MMWNLSQHTYEELREVVIDILLRRESVTYEPNQWASLTSGAAEVIGRRAAKSGQPPGRYDQPRLHPQDLELIRDVFWDLFRQGFITLGLNDSNPTWPWFRLSHFGQQALLTRSPYRFHNTTTFISLVKKEVPDLSSEAETYLEEAVAAFYADCLLAACVMIGVAAEAEFLRLVDVAAKSKAHGSVFAPVQKLAFIRQKITKFHSALKPLVSTLPRETVEDLDTNFAMIQSVLRIARNEAGHPTATAPGREQVYVFLQLFIPFARQLMRLRKALK
ncbi:MAG: hypothetical protein JO328_17385 [Hyphomicrobiales bacterium]|nr:hypothetical protein [Hyphomicrobiales bacterium]MBV8824129.1 hypothetical protein [Hyphomicrobiales bacterium]MBV9426815.1 hypothetical protein [Bradyrhizobiaceae bacterium]